MNPPIVKIAGLILSYKNNRPQFLSTIAKVGGRVFVSVFVALAVFSCSTAKPSVELVLAREAFNAARDVESARYAPGFYHKAEEAYRRGIAAYREKNYSDAVEEFRTARANAERAENAARLQRQKSGEEGL